MTSPRPGPSSEQQPPILPFDASDIGHSGPFMESLVTFLNEASLCINEVKQRAGIAPECATPVKMNEEEKQEKLNTILTTLVQKCRLEISTNESSYHTAQDISGSYATAQSSGAFRSAADSSMRSASPRQPRGRRADTPRPGTTPVRGRVATPDQYFIPLAQSSLEETTQSGFGEQGGLASSSSRLGPRARSGSPSPYSTLYDTSGTPGGFRSGAGAFDSSLYSQSGRSTSGYPSTSFGGDAGCSPQCAQSINSTGRSEYRRLRGQADPGVWRESSRTI